MNLDEMGFHRFFPSTHLRCTEKSVKINKLIHQILINICVEDIA